MKITKILIENLIKLSMGRPVSFSMSRNEVFGELLAQGVVKHVKRGCHNSLYAVEPETFRDYLAQRYAKLDNLENVLQYFDDVNSASQNQLAWTKPNADENHRIFFCANKCINAKIAGNDYIIQPCNDVETSILPDTPLSLPDDVIIVGVINKEVFNSVSTFYKFFDSTPHIYIYCDDFEIVANLVKGLNNRYIHFGNLDFEEIERYESMIFNEIGERAEFFLPDGMREYIKKGNIKLFKEQYRVYRNAKLKDLRLTPLRQMLIQHQRAFNMKGYLER